MLAWASLAPALLGAAWMVVAPRWPGLRGRRALRTTATWWLTRVAFAALVWGALGHLSLDALAFFVPQARKVLAGGLPYREFASAYGPLFAVVLAPAVAAFGV